jgi:uncharacterized integral membrane protein (TIGR00698 family)
MIPFRVDFRNTIVPGVALSAAIALMAIWISGLPFAPFTVADGRHPLEPVMLAIILGIVIANAVFLPSALTPGIKFTAKKVLPLGIVLLGARLDFMAIVKVGATGIVLSILTILLALAMFVGFVKLNWVPAKLGTLLGVGTAICGGTAIVATAPVIDAEDSDVSFAVATVTVLGLIAMFLLPVLGHAAHMSDQAFGIWAGLSIHQTPQVVASGMSYSPAAGDSATIVKLARVSLLAPVVAGIGMLYARKRSVGESLSAASLVKLFPIFILGFLMMALVRTLGWLPKPVIDWCDLISRFLITCAMAAVGLETTLKSLRNTGLRPFVLGALASVVICLLIVAALKVTSVAT